MDWSLLLIVHIHFVEDETDMKKPSEILPPLEKNRKLVGRTFNLLVCMSE